MSYTIIKPKDRAEWLKHREAGIGSSDVATILGLSPFETPLQLWRKKMKLDAPQPENAAMLMGHLLEDAVAQRWQIETGLQVIKSSQGDWLMVDNQRNYLRVSPDRTFWLPDVPKNKDNKGIVEIKTTMMDIDEESLPKHWYVQLMYQLGVAGYPYGYLAWLKMGRDFGTRRIDFDQELYDWMIEEVDKFWIDNIKGGKEPEPMNVADMLIKYPRSAEGKTIEATPELISACAELKMLKEQEASIKQTKADLEEKIKMALGDAEQLTCKGVTLASWKSAKDSQKFNEKAFATDHADLHEEYMQTVAGSRRFLIK